MRQRLSLVRGKTLSAARGKIKAAHCRVGKVTRAYSKTVRKGRVVSQKPKPKTKLASGGKVNLVVSRGRKH
jgi:beta-lactam-binding protein with PASTA domain